MKRYFVQYGIGKAKYVVSYHDGITKNKDGSEFFGIRIFKNLKSLGKFIEELTEKGYVRC
jgi:hypothetical protein